MARETQITSGVRLVSSSLTTLLAEERESLDQLQHLTERRDQLASALRTAQGRVEQLQREMMEPGEIMSDTELAALEEEVASLERMQQQATQHLESLRLDRVRLETRITMLRKQAVSLMTVIET